MSNPSNNLETAGLPCPLSRQTAAHTPIQATNSDHTYYSLPPPMHNLSFGEHGRCFERWHGTSTPDLWMKLYIFDGSIAQPNQGIFAAILRLSFLQGWWWWRSWYQPHHWAIIRLRSKFLLLHWGNEVLVHLHLHGDIAVTGAGHCWLAMEGQRISWTLHIYINACAKKNKAMSFQFDPRGCQCI